MRNKEREIERERERERERKISKLVPFINSKKSPNILS